MTADTAVPLAAADNVAVEYRLEAEDLEGNPISTIVAGQDYQLVAFVREIGSPISDVEGVFAGYLNVSYDPGLVSVAAGGTLIHGDFLGALCPSRRPFDGRPDRGARGHRRAESAPAPRNKCCGRSRCTPRQREWFRSALRSTLVLDVIHWFTATMRP